MVRRIDWESQIGRRLKLRDLLVFVTIVQRGSMAKAAEHLGVSAPAVSEIIAELEHALGVRLLDRGQKGVTPTMYGREMIERSRTVFDELKQGIATMEAMADPTVGAVRIGCTESLASVILAPVIDRFSRQYPRVRLEVQDVITSTLDFPELRERSLDVVLARRSSTLAADDDMRVEVLFCDEMVVVAGTQNQWANRHQIDIAELANEPWILTRPGTWNHTIVSEAFRARGLDMPMTCLATLSLALRNELLATGRFITAYPKSTVGINANRLSLKILPVSLPARPWPVEIITMKNRTLNTAAQRFIDDVRAFARTLGLGPVPAKSASQKKLV